MDSILALLERIETLIRDSDSAALASWSQAAIAIAAIFGSFALANSQFKQELKRDRERAAKETNERMAQLYDFIWHTWVQVRSLTIQEDRPPESLDMHWSQTNVRLELAKMEAALTQLQAIPVTELPKMKGGVKAVKDMISAVITTTMVLREHLDGEMTTDLQKCISEQIRPARKLAANAGLNAFAEYTRLTGNPSPRKWWQLLGRFRMKRSEPIPPRGAVDPNRKHFEITVRRMGRNIKSLTSVGERMTAYVDPITREMWQVWEASREATEYRLKPAKSAPPAEDSYEIAKELAAAVIYEELKSRDRGDAPDPKHRPRKAPPPKVPRTQLLRNRMTRPRSAAATHPPPPRSPSPAARANRGRMLRRHSKGQSAAV
ncbi:MAG: hypothetical protein JSS14_13525 [Proteobacteria bacterium]|nr:hypothetical protein [Pseudomonadota bacterium]